ncbi:putative leucine-rich repeat receptor-like protein kinase IMK3 [Capsicum annuum]|uniref:Leucine-rich repeat receptor-like protein kinase IMK3 n=1 Tax=Capsicum annuum TaxID=4072 RepID=A0A1U8GX67_CAPAN|nr:putative leucine-rich repeat receptor-like protein kinase IMK3 [Capsicum annuum]KAF3672234.1 putative leucine-rich repeat receptor-like protein kinase IMK3 [Capsicum annuum]PHT82113.1 putative leucine-rich repeat receptor-like protein kinase IMK3 [Capsicum annuum]
MEDQERVERLIISNEKWISFIQIFLFLQLLISSTRLTLCQDWDGIVITEANYQALEALKHELVDPQGYLSGWNDSGYGACSGTWVGIKCAKGQVIVIMLPLKGLGGRISESIGQLQELRKLSLHDNEITGSVPLSLGYLPNLRGVQLYNNRLSGTIPSSLGLCPVLQTLELSNNMLSGVIPDSLVNSTKLYRLNLSYNSLSGSIPASVTQSRSLVFIDLRYNNLSGSIPDSWGGNGERVRLQSLVLDHNSFTGGIPVSFGKLNELLEISLSHNHIVGVIPNDIGRLSMVRNLDFSCNEINGSLPESLSNLSSLVALNLESNNLDGEIPLDINKLQKLLILNLRNNRFRGDIPAIIGDISGLVEIDLSRNNLSGEIPVSVGDFPNLSSFNVSYNSLSGPVPTYLAKKFNSSAFVGNVQLCGYNTSNPCPGTPSKATRGSKRSIKDIILIVIGALIIILFLVCCILLCCLIKKRNEAKTAKDVKGVPPTAGEVEAAGDTGGKLVHFGGGMIFSADDLLCATADILGKSTYGTVYKATLEDGNQVAVKRMREKITKAQREFEKEVNVLGKIRHPNLLAIRAYYIGTKGEKLLIFDYMTKGSLATFLHARGPDTPVDWPTRMRIAKGTTRGLLYLHTNANIIHGNLTSSNVLLDENSDAKIADYGLSRLVTAAANTNVIATAGALGYRAPELNKLKKANVKTDVYSLGVIILELLTGKSPGEVMNGVDLPRKVASIVKQEGTNEVFDLELMRDASIIGDELLITLKLALHCVDPSPSARPELRQVLQQLEDIRRDTPTAAPSASH